MPRISLDTNLPASKIPSEFLSKCTDILSSTLGKSHRFCISTVNPGVKMTLGGSNDPCGLIQITSIGSIGPEENKKHIKAVTDYIHEATGIPKNKLYVHFQSNLPDSTGFIGTTFHQLFFVEKGSLVVKRRVNAVTDRYLKIREVKALLDAQVLLETPRKNTAYKISKSHGDKTASQSAAARDPTDDY